MLKITSKPIVLKFWYNLARFGNENYQSCSSTFVCTKLKSAVHKHKVDHQENFLSTTALPSASNDQLEIMIFLPWKFKTAA